MSYSSLRIAIAAATAGTAAAVLLALPAAAGADCRNVWAPSPSGGQLILICDANTAPGSGSGNAAGGKRKQKSFWGAIALNPIPVQGEGGAETYSGTTTAGYKTKRKAERRALRTCSGECKTMATVRNGWAMLVATPGAGGEARFFSATAKQRGVALNLAESRARKRLGDGLSGPIELVVGVDSRPRSS